MTDTTSDAFAIGYVDATGAALPEEHFAFGDSPALADELAQLVAVTEFFEVVHPEPPVSPLA